MTGDWLYARGLKVDARLADTIFDLRLAAKLDPFDWRIRGASARKLSSIALTTDDKDWMIAARPELLHALQNDHSSPDLLAKLIDIDLALGNTTEAQFYYNRFKRVARASPIIKFVNDLHEKADIAVTAKP